jgi:hypothetical protein
MDIVMNESETQRASSSTTIGPSFGMNPGVFKNLNFFSCFVKVLITKVL